MCQTGFLVERSALVGILSVVQDGATAQTDRELGRERTATRYARGFSPGYHAALSQVAGDHRVVECDVLEGLRGQGPTLIQRQPAVLHGIESAVVVRRIAEHDDVGEILR